MPCLACFKPTTQFAWISFLALILMKRCKSDVDGRPNEIFDVCEGETFRLSCPQEHVIVMRTAEYGRMRAGHCLSRGTTLEIGCKSDILHLVDAQCSGRQECEVKVETNFEQSSKYRIMTCSSEIRKYLAAEYYCQKVTVGSNFRCTLPISLHVDVHGLYIVQSLVTEKDCEVINLQADPGQSLKFVLFDFSRREMNGPTLGCPTKLGSVADSSSGQRTEICLGISREREIFDSESEKVQLLLDKFTIQDSSFMMYIYAQGCGNLPPRPGAWYKRDGAELLVGCSGSQKSWRLTCSNNRWTGVVGNCSDVPLGQQPETLPKEDEGVMTNGVIITLICSVSAVICTLIVMLGIACLKRWSLRERRALDNMALEIQVPGPPTRLPSNTLRTEPVYAVYDRIPADDVADARTMPQRFNTGCPPRLPQRLLQGFDDLGREVR